MLAFKAFHRFLEGETLARRTPFHALRFRLTDGNGKVLVVKE
jgi:hypothetical protein